MYSIRPQGVKNPPKHDSPVSDTLASQSSRGVGGGGLTPQGANFL